MKNNELKYGFRLVSEQDINEISSISRRFLHEQSGAELLHFENTDNNKVFLIVGFVLILTSSINPSTKKKIQIDIYSKKIIFLNNQK